MNEPCRRCAEPCTTPLCWCCIATVMSMSAFGDGECWLAYPGEPYQVSSLGRVKSTRTGKLLTPFLHGRGRYPAVRLGKRERCRPVHQLVLESFIGTRPPGRWALHHNDVGTDNRLFNLYWGTPDRQLPRPRSQQDLPAPREPAAPRA